MSVEMQRAWLLAGARRDVDQMLTEFIAQREMKLTNKHAGVIEATRGATWAIDAGGSLDLLPMRARIWYRPEATDRTRVQAYLKPRGRPRLMRRQQIKRFYETKMSGWLTQLDATLSANADHVEEVPW